jgi:biopolymer transport protein ExbD
VPAAHRIELPRRQGNYRFALTPLADAMFQLLIFLMLSSSLTPYSLLPLQSTPDMPTRATASVAPGEAPETPPPSSNASKETALWTVVSQAVVVGGQRFGFDALDDLANALGQPGMSAKVILIVAPDARVQDVATVLARLRRADINEVQITDGGA